MELARQEEAPASSFASLAARVDGWLGKIVEWPVAILTALEVVILFAGVVSRYVFRNPFVWSDELASILFLWLAMLGAVVAFRRGEHMRMSTLVARASPRVRVFFEAFAVAVAVAFLAMILHPAIEYAVDEAAIVTPAMEIPNIWRATALPVGCALMLMFSMLRLARSGGVKDVLLALVVIAAIGAGLWMLKPVFVAMGNYKLIVFFILLVAAGVLAGAPIAFVFAIATFAFLAITTRTPLTVVVSRIDEGHEPHHPAFGAAVRVPRAADRGDRHGAHDGGLPREPAWARAGRALLRAAGCDVPRVRHLGLEGRRHGGGRAGAVPRNEAARRKARRTGGAALILGRDVGGRFRRASC